MSEVTPEQGAGTIESAAQKIGAMLEPMGDPEPEKEEQEINAQEEQEPEETEIEVSEVKDESDEVEQEAAPEAEEAPQGWTLDEFAEATGMTREDALSNVKLKVKVDGLESEVNLDELTRGYQREAHTTQSQMALAKERETFKVEQETAKAEMQAKLQQVDQVLNAQEAQLIEGYNSVNWAQMQTQDAEDGTAHAVNLKQQYQEGFAQVQAQKEMAKQENTKLAKENQEKAQKVNQEWVALEHAAFVSIVPEWGDPKTAKAESAKLLGYLTEDAKVQQHEMYMFTEHRLRNLARKAMLWDALQDGKPALEKKVRSVPKLVKPGSPPSKNDMKSNAKAK